MEHLEAIARVYGPEAWDVYERLDRSLDPRGPDAMLELAAGFLSPASAVLDVGCRDGSHLVELVRRTGAAGAGVEPLPRFVEAARAAVAGAGLSDRIRIDEGSMQALPYPDGDFDLVWCRDVIQIVEGLDEAFAEVARVVRPAGRVLLYTVFATDRLDRSDAALLAQHLAVIPENLVEGTVEGAFARARLVVERKDVVGTEWREWAEERTQPASRDLLRLARLRRQRDELAAEVGEELVGHVEANLHWLAFQLLGKLMPTLYLLRTPGA